VKTYSNSRVIHSIHSLMKVSINSSANKRSWKSRTHASISFILAGILKFRKLSNINFVMFSIFSVWLRARKPKIFKNIFLVPDFRFITRLCLYNRPWSWCTMGRPLSFTHTFTIYTTFTHSFPFKSSRWSELHGFCDDLLLLLNYCTNWLTKHALVRRVLKLRNNCIVIMSAPNSTTDTNPSPPSMTKLKQFQCAWSLLPSKNVSKKRSFCSFHLHAHGTVLASLYMKIRKCLLNLIRPELDYHYKPPD
jgi:hypothetical protein